MNGREEEKDYYAILGAGREESREEIERRYKRLAVKHHPDRGGDEDAMKELNEAYRVLGDGAARAAYDAARGPSVATTFVPVHTPSAGADALGGRVVGALLSLFAGLVLLLLVRAHYVVFLWPLALLALALVFGGVWIAHAALSYARACVAPTHVLRRSAWAQEALFWSAVAGGAYAVYLALVSL